MSDANADKAIKALKFWGWVSIVVGLLALVTLDILAGIFLLIIG